MMVAPENENLKLIVCHFDRIFIVAKYNLRFHRKVQVIPASNKVTHRTEFFI